jgi:DNA-binding transcriptional LysR family regulator
MQELHTMSTEVDFHQLKTFLALAQVANFSETGRRLGLSQSAVSRHIRGLEDSLGLRLFERLGRHARLTSAGRTLRARLQTLIREVESLPRVVRDLAEGVVGDLRIAASTTAANAILPPLLAAYRRRYPAVLLSLQPANTGRILELLSRGEIDLAFVGCESLPSGVAALAEIADEIVMIAPREHPFAGRRIRPDDLKTCDFLQRDIESDTGALVAGWLRATGVQPRVVMELG